MVDLVTCHALWIGPSLPPQAAGCLRSFIRHGHRVVLHVYEDIGGIPSGVEVSDASLIVPFENVFRFQRTGSYAIFSDYFRYKLLKAGAELWIDCDVYCVRPFDFPGPHLFGLQSPDSIAIGVLRIPADSPLLRDLLKVFDDHPRRPPWVGRVPWARARLKALLTGAKLLAVTTWGVSGPKAMTWCTRNRGLSELAQPIDVLYPIPKELTHVMAKKSAGIIDFIRPETRCIHLWNEIIRIENIVPEKGSFLDRVAQEGLGGPPALDVSD